MEIISNSLWQLTKSKVQLLSRAILGSGGVWELNVDFYFGVYCPRPKQAQAFTVGHFSNKVA